MISEATVQAMRDYFSCNNVTTKQLKEYEEVMKQQVSDDSWKLVHFARQGFLPKLKQGVFRLETAKPSDATPAPVAAFQTIQEESPASSVQGSATAAIKATASYVPSKNPSYVPFGVFKDIHSIMKSEEYVPTLVVGESGNGKTLSILQAAARLGRNVVTASIDFTTTDEELIGKFGLVDGNTVYERGPVRIAAEEGCVLILDELDRGNPETLICLNALLDGYPVLDKKTGETIVPKPGFQVMATANTKGQGDESDRFVSAKVMDEAFLERFPIVLEQDYPTYSQEVKILSKICSDESFCEDLARWAQATRESYKVGAIDNFITTRRLTFIAGKNYAIFNNRRKAVELAVARFPSVTRESFIQLFDAISSGDYDSSAPSNEPVEF